MTRHSFGIALVGLLVMGLVGLYGVGWELSRPVPARIGPAPVELQAEAITFRSESGSMIRGWLSRGTTHGGVVLLLPGVRANRLAMVDRALVLHAAGYSTLLIDFQATGESPGDAITFGWRERLDVIAAVQTLRRMLPGEPIGIIGTSLGGAATLLAAPALDVQEPTADAIRDIGGNVVSTPHRPTASATGRIAVRSQAHRSHRTVALPDLYHWRNRRSAHDSGRYATTLRSSS